MRALVLVLAVGCYSPAYSDCEVRCTSGTCPSGLTCTAGFCRSPNPIGSCGGGGSADAALDGPNIDAPYPTAMWGPATEVPLPGVTTSIGDPTLTEDLLEMYLVISSDIYVTRRSTVSDPWGAPTVVVELSSADVDQTPNISADGLMMVLASTRLPNAGDVDLWVSTRGTRSDPWSPPVRIDELATAGGDYGPSLTYDKLSMYLTILPAGGTSDIYLSTRSSLTAMWGPPVPVDGLMTTGFDSHPSISRDQRTIYFFRVINLDDLFVATRPTLNDPFQSAAIIELDTPDSDSDPWVSPDGHTIFFDRAPSGAPAVLYTATR